MFWSKRKTGKLSSELTLDAALKAVARYGELMERQGTAFLDVSLLPLPKAQMKLALKMAWESAGDERLKTMVEVGFTNLSNFQEGIGNQPIDCKLPPSADPVKVAAMIEPWLKWSKVAQAESDALIVELHKFISVPDNGGVGYARLGDQCVKGEDYAGAVRWYRLASSEGHVGAQAQLGRIYATGTGVPQDWAEAVKWARAAAEQGDVYSQGYLGELYANGRGVPVDHAEAAKWAGAAADQGSSIGQIVLGTLCNNGEDVVQDRVRAYALFSLAACERPGSRPEHVKKAADLRDFVAGNLSPEDLAKAKTLADSMAKR